ncbi:hypothetical protein DBV08_18220 [Rhodococcus sp. KBW08]|uniref:RidA family protein n=1 Tax=Rhodococcus sp. KBW08 TaxID=2144188 RepID=UPI000F5934F1|nr:hypothetical protein DBV08_18220 [Rhodococcus sp. KBW08]
MLYLSGHVGVDSSWGVFGFAFQDEARQVFRNIASTLSAAGCTLKDAVVVRTYISDFRRLRIFQRRLA